MDIERRLSVLVFLFIFFTGLIIVRLFYWQVIKAEELAILGSDQWEKIKKINPVRGEILTADGFPLVSSKESYLLFANLKKIKEEEKKKIVKSLTPIIAAPQIEATSSAKKKEEILDENSEKLKALLEPEEKLWVPLQKKLSLVQKEQIENLEIEGLGFEQEMLRFYPEASMAAHLTGFVGANFAGEQTGYFGIEGFYNFELEGQQGVLVQEKDVSNDPILTGFFNKEEKKDGKNLILHLDRSFQLSVEKELEKAVEKYKAKSGWVVVIEPYSGAVLSMAAYPRYEQARFSDYSKEVYKNPCIAESYEPGSTFKVLVMAAALDQEVITPETKCAICEKPFKIDKYIIKTWNDEYYPNQTMREVIKNSDNVGMVFVGQKLGKDKLAEYLERLGVGKKTGIDLQEEGNVSLKDKKQWSNVDLATASFGQGLAVTGIQMVRAVAAIANGGSLPEPHVVAKIEGEKKSLEIKPKIITRVLKEKATREITEMMVNAVEEGEVKWTKLDGYKIAGKTGTAQIPVAGHYDKEKTIASFIGFAPADKPRFVMLTYLREPTSSPWGSETAAPLFFKIAEKLFFYYGIPPE